MKTTARNALLMALAVAFAPACGSDDGEGEDAEDAPDEEEGSACPCIPVAGSGSETAVGLQDLDCFCRENDCQSYAQRTAEGQCGTLNTYAGCNLVEVAGSAYVGISFTYDATTHRLVGARTYSDIADFDCGGEAVYGHKAGIIAYSDFPDCALTESTPLCE